MDLFDLMHEEDKAKYKPIIMSILQAFADAFPKEKGISSSHVKIHRFIDELKNKLGLE